MPMPKGLAKYWRGKRKKKYVRSRSIMSRGYRHHKTKFTLPVAVILGFAPLVSNTLANVQSQGLNKGIRDSTTLLIPYDFTTRKITFANLGGGLWPMLAGLLVHKVVGGALGINRALARSGIPYIRI